MTDAQGIASFHWTPGTAAANSLTLSVEALPAVSLTLRAGAGVPVIAAVVNAASFEPGMAAGALQTIFGENLAGASLALDGLALPVSYSSSTQVNFLVPASVAIGPATLTVTIPNGERVSRKVEVAAVQPGIFAIRAAGDGYYEIYCTGLGPIAAGRTTFTPVVFIGATPVQPLFSGSSGIPGLYQVNVRVPAGSSGGQAVMLSVNLLHSNTVTLP
jgi:hypothetical protein